jgi:HNH endonuclease
VTKRKAERLTGYGVRLISNGSGVVRHAAFSGEDLMAEAEHRKETIALTLLINRVYQLHSRRVLDEYGWRCTRCGRSHGLKIHHRKYRSQGGTHRPENLEPVWSYCHHLIHSCEHST